MDGIFYSKTNNLTLMNQLKLKSIISIAIVAVVAIITLCSLGRIGEDVKNEQIVVNQMPFTGTMKYWTTPGFEWQWFGKTTVYYKTQQVWFGADNEEGKQMGNPIKVTFNDASDGQIYGSLRVKLPTDPTYLARIQTDYNGMDRLMQDLVRQQVTKVIYASGPLMSAFESYAEKKNDLIEYITDQLNNGVYKTTVKTIETVDPITGEKKTIKIASLIPDENAPGGYKRSESSPFSYYGLEIGQVSVSRIGYSDKVVKQIEQQQEANMMVQTSKAKTLAAQQEAIRAEEAGKAAAMEAKWQQEKVKAVEVTKAEQEYEVARLAALKAKEEAKRIEAEGQAKAAANRALVNAGLTPLERATIDKETKIGVAQALSSIKLPTYVVAGGNGGNGNTAMDAMGLKMMTDLVNQMSK
jgi:regulator of protease activity HflC (stomatin/prohibitin superfamily)